MMRWITASNSTATTITATVFRSHGRVAMASTVPAAGGCSVSVRAIERIRTPTEVANPRLYSTRAPSKNSDTGAANSRRANAEPIPNPRIWPPHRESNEADLLDG